MFLDPARVFKPLPVPEDLLCAICTGVLQDPVEGACEHVACRECMAGWLRRTKEKNCPTCRLPLSEETLKQAHRIVRNQLDALEVSCENAARGCSAVVALGALQKHLLSCGKAIEPCGHSGCVATVLREDLPKHVQACPHRIVPCDLCNARMKHQERQKHLLTHCPGVEVPCQHNGGCGKKMRRDAMATHIKTECSRATISCAFAGCKKQMARGAMKEHLENSMAEHLMSLSLSLEQANITIAAQAAELAKLKKSVPADYFHCVATFHEDNNHVGAMAAGAGVFCAVGGNDTLRVWSIDGYTCRKVLKFNERTTFGAVLTVDKGVLYAFTRENGSRYTLRSWSIPDFRLVEESAVTGLYTIHDGNFYAIQNGQVGKLLPNRGNKKNISSRLDFKPFDIAQERKEGQVDLAIDHHMLWIFCKGGGSLPWYIKAWDTVACKIVKTIEGGSGETMVTWTLGGGIIAAQILQEKSRFVFHQSAHTFIQVWSTSDFKCLANVKAPHCTCLAAGSGFLFGGGYDGAITVWSLKNFSRLETELCDHKSRIEALLVHDGMLYSGSEDGRIKVWRIPNVDNS